MFLPLVVTTTNMTKTWFIHPFNLFRHESACVCVSPLSPCEEGSWRSRGGPSASVKHCAAFSVPALVLRAETDSGCEQRVKCCCVGFAVLLRTVAVKGMFLCVAKKKKKSYLELSQRCQLWNNWLPLWIKSLREAVAVVKSCGKSQEKHAAVGQF